MTFNDHSSLLRIDAAFSLPFFLACAAALSEQGLMPEIEADTLRLTIKDRYRQMGDVNRSLFSELFKENGPFISELQTRLGSHGLSQLYLSWTIAHTLEKSLVYLDELASGLLKKAELMFNQPFFIFREEMCEQRTFFSTFLVEAAEHIHESREDFAQLLIDLRVLHPRVPSSSEVGTQWEQSLAMHLGYRYGEGGALAELRMQQTFKLLFLRWDLLADRLSYISSQLAQNLGAAEAIDQMYFALEDWSGHLARIRSYPTLGRGSWDRHEQHRLRLLASLLHIQDILESIGQSLLENLKTSLIGPLIMPLWPEAERREVVTYLLTQGVPYQQAQSALKLLESYCKQHQTEPHLLLSAEIQRLHSSLNEGFLQNLKKVAMDRGVATHLTEEKQRVLKRKDHLLKTIKSHLLVLVLLPWPLATLSLGLSGCGFKTLPQSEVLDLRPAIPYHAQQRNNSSQKSAEGKAEGKHAAQAAEASPPINQE